jgi:hypothetical protein
LNVNLFCDKICFMNFFYFLGAYVFYFLGDLSSKISTESFYILYQKFMNISYNFDEKIGFKIWKLPENKS